MLLHPRAVANSTSFSQSRFESPSPGRFDTPNQTLADDTFGIPYTAPAAIFCCHESTPLIPSTQTSVSRRLTSLASWFP